MDEIISVMTQTEAHEWKRKVSTQANSLRLLIAEGYERQAWKALGYRNWTECVKGISEEFQLSENYIWRLQAANEVQRNLLDNCQVTENLIPEGQLRPLTKLEPAEQVRVWEQVVATAPEGKITAAHVQAVVDQQTILQAAKAIQAERREEKRAERIEIIVNETRDLTNVGKFNVIYADPPWRYEYSISVTRDIENQYPTMPTDEICALPVLDMAHDDCVLFLWATSPKLTEAIKVMESWGFTYKTNMVWVKDKIGMGYYARQQHEILLIGTKGNLPTPAPENRVSSVVYADRNQHSSKPLEFYSIIENMYPEYKKIELFCRNPQPGWDAWGNQI